MPYERTGYAPWSLTREAGVQSATVDGTIQVPQYGQPVIDIGFVDEKGNWQGRKSSDEVFIGITKAEAIPNGASVLFPDTNAFPSIDMEGFLDIFIAIKPTRTGNVAINAVMGPDTQPFANLSPVNPASTLRGDRQFASTGTTLQNLFADSSEALTANVWNIFMISKALHGQRNMQFQITNDSGDASDIEFGFMRLA